jgi:hypothetical protein
MPFRGWRQRILRQVRQVRATRVWVNSQEWLFHGWHRHSWRCVPPRQKKCRNSKAVAAATALQGAARTKSNTDRALIQAADA